jgi:hypothetical protein
MDRLPTCIAAAIVIREREIDGDLAADASRGSDDQGNRLIGGRHCHVVAKESMLDRQSVE